MVFVEVGEQAGVDRFPAKQLPGLRAWHRDVHRDEREALGWFAACLAGMLTAGTPRSYEQWAESPGEQTLTDFTRHSLYELRAASATLD